MAPASIAGRRRRDTVRSHVQEKGDGGLRGAPIPSGDEIGAAELAGRVADHLREQRKRREMSLDQLAQLTGVSRAALSQIETRKTNPTIGVLWKIASGLGVGVLGPHR